MPWSVEQQGNKYCVVKEGGAVVACHMTRSRALRHQRALYANEPRLTKSKRMLTENDLRSMATLPDGSGFFTAVVKARPVSNGESAPAKSGGGYGARAGEVITGNLARGNDGKFTSAGNASAAKPAAKPAPAPTGRRATDLGRPKPKKGRAVKPKKGPDPAKAAERAKRRAEATAKRMQREADKKKREQESQQKKLDRAVQNEMKRREQFAKRDEAATKRAARAAERAKRRAAADLKKQAAADKPKGGGGGKGSAAKPKPEAAKPDKAIVAAENRAKVGQALGIDTTALASLADGTQPDPATATALTAAGLMSKNRNGTYSTTASGRAVLNAAERGDERQARAMLARGRDTQAGRDEQRARTEARTRDRESRAAQREADKKKRRKSFAVFKDHAGRLRWLAVSSTAFQDRDGEIVSVKALEDDVARSDATGQYGPLRFWHVPGLDIGDCDFRAVHGRSLIESGTFRDERYAAAVKDGDQVSLGFLHTLDQPTPDKIFEAIHTFERSVTPAGRASNPFTRLTIQEVQMLTKEKQDELASRVGPDILETLLAGVEQTEKAADAAGVRHKESARVAVWDEEAQAWAEVTTKAPAGEVMPEIEEPIAVELDEEPVEAEGGYFTPEELAEITSAIAPIVAAAVVEQLSPMLNMEAKMSKFTDELKGMVAPQLAQKDAAIAEQAATLAAVKAEADAISARLKNLEGDQPRGAGYRPSEAKDNLVGEASVLKAAQPTADSGFLQFFGTGQ